jgi:hypothetical protein
MLFVLESHLSDAALALRMFEHERRRPITIPRDQSLYERRRQLEFEREAALPAGLPHEDRRTAYESIRLGVEIELKREGWAAGGIPEAHARRAIFLYAQTFVYALDGIGKTLRVLASMPSTPQPVTDAAEWFDQRFPTLKGVRDSSHHLEDRVRGRDRRGKPLDLKPVDNAMVRAPGGALILGSLNNNRYGSTTDDGSYGEVEVSGESLDIARSAIQRVLDGFSWTGPKRHVP